MTDDDLPKEVRNVLREHIVSVEQLEILLLMRERAGAEIDVKTVSEEIRTSERSAAERLADLERQGFVRANHHSQVDTYRYAPATPALRHAVDLLAESYAERRYTIIDLIFAKPIDKLKVYADAFRFRSDDGDG